MYKKCVCIKDITLGDVFLNTAVFKANTVYEYKKYYRERRAIIKLNFRPGGWTYVFLVNGIEYSGASYDGSWTHRFNEHFMDLSLFREQQINGILE